MCHRTKTRGQPYQPTNRMIQIDMDLKMSIISEKSPTKTKNSLRDRMHSYKLRILIEILPPPHYQAKHLWPT